MPSNFDLSNIPQEVLQQFWLEQQNQILGEGPAAFGGYSPDTGAVNTATSNVQSNTSVVNQGTQRVLNNGQISSTTFNGLFYLPYNPNRVWLAIQNQGGAPIYVSFTGQSGAITSGFSIAAGFYWEPFVAPVNSVNISGSNGVVMEGVLG